ncbi:thioesterase family protein [Clostridium hydrogeniformans]|uniref:thioesterase family protein n=1 Tax=Clostridium hydrogeniformans TaxID=349933 RepID=UPI00048533B0|nr:thioesterase family protein [Clostridium hydrogeniformans]
MNIKEGTKFSQIKKVTEEDSANKYGSGTLEVFATPAMISFIENTCKNSVEGCLDQGFTTVGTEVSIKHIKATPIGMEVVCTSELIEVKGKKLVFSVEVVDEEGKIGEGLHKRYIVNSEDFLKNTYK